MKQPVLGDGLFHGGKGSGLGAHPLRLRVAAVRLAGPEDRAGDLVADQVGEGAGDREQMIQVIIMR